MRTLLSFVILLYLFTIVVTGEVKSIQQQQQRESSFTFFLDSYQGTETNVSCLDESIPCVYMSQVIDSARSILQLGNNSSTLSLEMNILNLSISKCKGSLTIQTSIENANILESEFNSLEITSQIQNLVILNDSITYLQGNLKAKQVKMETINISNFKLVEIKNCHWSSFSGTSLFHGGEKFSILSSIITGPMMFEVVSVLEIINVTVSRVNFEPENGNFFGIATVDQVTIERCNFVDNTIGGSMISVQRCKNLLIVNCKHSNNLSKFITILSSSRNRITIQDSEFFNNQASDALIVFDSNYVVDSTILLLDNCNFVNNIGGLTGSALKITKANVLISSCNFSFNKAGYGGAVYMISQLSTVIEYSNFTNNEATQSGGAIYVGDVSNLRQWETVETICDSNNALEAGGCLYMKGKSKIDVVYNFAGINKAICYGNNIATELTKKKFEFRLNGFEYQLITNQSIQIYPGESLDLRIILSDRYNQKSVMLPENQMSMKINSNNLVLQTQGFTSGNDSILSNNIQILLKEYQYANFHEETTFSFILKDIEHSIRMKLVDCPPGYTISKNYGNVKCEYIPIEIILPAAIVGAISLIIIFVTVILVGIYIVKKLKKLRRQERAEKEIQKKFIDNSFVFNNGSNGSDLSVPLVEKSFNSEDSIRYTIPIAEIDILSKIGEGSNGLVYKAKWNRTDVAIKQLKTLGEEDDEEFEREALLMSSLRHPSVVSCYGVSITNDSKYMVVEYLENGSLEKALYKSKIGKEKLSFETKLNILLDVGKGMTYLHSIRPNKIIHRDLKPGNILLTKNLNAKVSDFGLSKMVSNNTATMTTNVGTLLYIELLSNYHKGQTTKLDVYSFGLIMWEVLFEMVPFSNELSDATTPFSILLQVTNGLRPSLSVMGEHFEYIQEWIEDHFTMREIQKIGKQTIEKCLKDYIEVMKLCWYKEPSNRPEFIEITESLELIIEQIRK
ncbi:predicted protein [Naegleria gruberi]|uniref:non-specific serine/threonine protein kinase n=1 Tax=Naegleria gruberi TaxID=5762 RepID=D2W2W9_NAEGR|nr:uncharacterized protein NAEGRDRAFT_75740 [Naegleria gruberi]EFC36588.1 predicted protein [Naegleria gruberi]|eukprot:XP_002669332.1 predicted protein [Naegleria gruberi strain NEG-M]